MGYLQALCQTISMKAQEESLPDSLVQKACLDESNQLVRSYPDSGKKEHLNDPGTHQTTIVIDIYLFSK